MNLCECGCGQSVKRRFAIGHGFIWNKGLTKVIDERVAQNAKNISIAMIGQKYPKERCLNIGIGHVGQIPWNKGLKTNRHSSNFILRENRQCKCGCLKFFECKVNNNQRFIHGHNGRGKNNGMYNTSKFSGKDSPYWIQREIRYCACGCGQFKEVKSNSKWKFVQYHHMKDKEVLKKRGIKLSENAKINPNYGMKNKHHTKETKEKISFIGTGRPSLK